MGRRQRADRGMEGWGGPHQKAKDPSPQQTNPRATPSRDSTGPLVGPSRIQFHWATRPTMTWRHAGWGHGILRRSGCPFLSVLQLHIHVHQRRCHFVAPMPAARVGSQLGSQLHISSPPSAALSTPRHETSGPLLDPAQSCSPLFVTSGVASKPPGAGGRGWGGV